MKRLCSTVAFALVLAAAGPAALLAQEVEVAEEQTPEEAAIQVANAWLELMDADEYEKSWEEAASIFQGSVTARDWTLQAASVRAQIGDVESRELESAGHTTDLPEAPPGEYVILVHNSAFEEMPAVREVVTVVNEDGEWKVVGYFIQPND